MGFDEEEKFVSIVVPSGRNPVALRACLAFLRTFTELPHEIQIADQGHFDLPAGETGVLCTNLGTPGAIRVALQESRGNYLCWVEPGIRVGPGWLKGMLAIYRVFDRCGITVPRRLDSAEVVTRGERHARYPNLLVDAPLDLACALMPRWIYNTVGPFDPRYQMRQVADADYYERLRQAGFFLGVSGGALVDWRPFEFFEDDELARYDSWSDQASHEDRRHGLVKAQRIAAHQASGLGYVAAQRLELGGW